MALNKSSCLLLVTLLLWLSIIMFCIHGWRYSKNASNKNIITSLSLHNDHRSFVIVNRKMLSSSSSIPSTSSSGTTTFDFTPFYRHHHHKHHGHHHHRHYYNPEPPPPGGGTNNGHEIDPRYGVEKRLVPTGPNPLHH